MENNLKKFHFRPDFYFESASDFCYHLVISKYDIASLTGCHPNTAQKWINSDDPPRWLLPFLYAVCGGVICCDSFYGWKLHDGMIYAPGLRYGLTASQVESFPWYIDTLKQSQARLRKLKKAQAIKKAGCRPSILHFPDNGSETV